MTIAPFNIAQDYINTLKLRAIGISSIALAVALSIGAVTTERQWQRTLLLASALGMTGVSRIAEDARLTQARINKDVVDISDASRQQRLYEYFTSTEANTSPAPVLEISPLIDIPDSANNDVANEFDGAIAMYDLVNIAGENHLAVIGGTGAGKSFLTQHLISTYFPSNADVIAMDTDAKPTDWPGVKVCGQAGNTNAIEGQMGHDLRLLQRRTELNSKGSDVGNEVVRIIEELPTVTADIQDTIDSMELEKGEKKPPNTATDWLKRMLRRGRKYRMMVVLVSQSFNVRSLKIDGEGDLRENLTVIYLAGKAYKVLSQINDKDQREATRQWLSAQSRPALVDVGGILMRFPVPDLSQRAGSIDVESHPAQAMTTGSATSIKLDNGSELSADYAEATYKLIKACLDNGETKTNILKKIGMYGSRYAVGMDLWEKLQAQFGPFAADVWDD